MKKIREFVLNHKIISFLVVAALAGGGFWGYKILTQEQVETRYVTQAAEKGTLVVSTSGSGQVVVSDELDIKSKASGDVLEVDVAAGDEITPETIIAKIDDSDAKKTLRDAYSAYDSAKIELDRLLEPPTDLELFKAENAVETAKKSLDDLLHPTDSVLSQAENSLQSAQDSLTKLKFSQDSTYGDAVKAEERAQDDLDNSYEDAFNTVATVFLDFPSLMTGLQEVLYSYGISDSEATLTARNNVEALRTTVENHYGRNYDIESFIDQAEDTYQTARDDYEANFNEYKSLSRYSNKDDIRNLLDDTVDTARAISEAVKNQTNLLDYWVDYRSTEQLPIFNKVVSYQSDVRSYTSTITKHLSSLLSAQRTLDSNKESLADAQRKLTELAQNQPLDLAASERSVEEKQEVLDKLNNPEQSDIEAAEIAVKEKQLLLDELKAGADELDIKNKRNTLSQRWDTYQEAKNALADHEIHSTIGGIVSALNVKKGDTVSNNSSIATVIGNQKLAQISLNEIDAAKVKVGQKATLSFDAAEDIEITGKVIEVDTVGTVSQGVVSYGVKIAFDVDDDRIKPGMSVSASIISDSKQNVLLVPIGAVKSSGNSSYVEVLVNGVPQRKAVTIGLSNDTTIEIVSGLDEGEEVVTQTITGQSSSTSSSTSSQSQGFSRPQGAESMGGMMRIMR